MAFKRVLIQKAERRLFLSYASSVQQLHNPRIAILVRYFNRSTRLFLLLVSGRLPSDHLMDQLNLLLVQLKQVEVTKPPRRPLDDQLRGPGMRFVRFLGTREGIYVSPVMRNLLKQE